MAGHLYFSETGDVDEALANAAVVALAPDVVMGAACLLGSPCSHCKGIMGPWAWEVGNVLLCPFCQIADPPRERGAPQSPTVEVEVRTVEQRLQGLCPVCVY